MTSHRQIFRSSAIIGSASVIDIVIGIVKVKVKVLAVLLVGPVLLAMITLAPWVIHLPYSGSFSPAAGILRWQVLGDILKVVSWPMSFIVVAAGRGEIFIGTEFSWCAAYLGSILLGIPEFRVPDRGSVNPPPLGGG